MKQHPRSKGDNVKAFPNAKSIPQNEPQPTITVELGKPSPKGGIVPESWIPYMLYFVDFSTGVRIPIISKEDPATVEKWAKTLKSTSADGKVIAGAYFHALTVVGPVAKPPEEDFNPSSIVLPQNTVKPSPIIPAKR